MYTRGPKLVDDRWLRIINSVHQTKSLNTENQW